MRLGRRPVARTRRAALPLGADRPPRHLRRPRDPARPMPRLWRRPSGRGPLRRRATDLYPVLRALRPGVGPPHDHQGRRQAPRRQLGRHQGPPEARPGAPVRQAQAQAPAAHRHRRDRDRQGAPLPDGGPRPRQRRRGLRRRWQGGQGAEAVLEAAQGEQGEDRGGGHGHVAGVPRGGLDKPARCEDRLRPVPCDEALQREALRPASCVVPRGDRRAPEEGPEGDAVAAAEGGGRTSTRRGTRGRSWRRRWG